MDGMAERKRKRVAYSPGKWSERRPERRLLPQRFVGELRLENLVRHRARALLRTGPARAHVVSDVVDKTTLEAFVLNLKF